MNLKESAALDSYGQYPSLESDHKERVNSSQNGVYVFSAPQTIIVLTIDTSVNMLDSTLFYTYNEIELMVKSMQHDDLVACNTLADHGTHTISGELRSDSFVENLIISKSKKQRLSKNSYNRRELYETKRFSKS